VAGLYKTGIEEYDKLFAICDIRLLRRIYQWQHEEIGGFEIILNDYRQMDSVSRALYKELPGRWTSRTIGEVYPNIFDWLRIMNVNRNVIFIVMSVVAAINLVTCLLILILERTRMIGILKAMGSTDGLIRSIFLYNALFISGIGTFIGLAIGLGFSLLQQQFGLIKMNEAAYYVSVAPVYIVWWQVLLVCICTQVVCLTSLLLPVYLIKKISPVKAIRFS
jgi:lipoprotein-releasing system permease protein